MKKGHIGVSDFCKLTLAVTFGHGISFKVDRGIMVVILMLMAVIIALCELYGRKRDNAQQRSKKEKETKNEKS